MSAFCILLDENVPRIIQTLLQQQAPQIQVFVIGDGFAPPKGTPDPEILCWIEENHCLLVTNNRASMPAHLQDHLEQGQHIPGILQLPKQLNLRELLEDLVLIGEALQPNELQDQIVYLPL